jgi:hypothetical protein
MSIHIEHISCIKVPGGVSHVGYAFTLMQTWSQGVVATAGRARAVSAGITRTFGELIQLSMHVLLQWGQRGVHSSGHVTCAWCLQTNPTLEAARRMAMADLRHEVQRQHDE